MPSAAIQACTAAILHETGRDVFGSNTFASSKDGQCSLLVSEEVRDREHSRAVHGIFTGLYSPPFILVIQDI